MAEGKKSFVAYSDWDGMFKALPDDVAGKLIKHIFSYVNDQNPETEDYIINALFEQIKATLKRDLAKWDTQREQRSEAGKKSAELRALTKSNDRSIPLNETQRNPTVTVSDSVKETKGISPTVNWDGLLSQFNDITGKKLKVVDDKSKRQFLARLKDGYTKNDIVNAITNCFNSDFHKSNGHKNLTLEFISRPDKFAMYFDFKETIVKPIKQDRL